MNGCDVKKLLVSNNINLNCHKYFDNTSVYDIDDIPNVLVDKELLRKKLTDAFGVAMSEYIIMCTYNTSDKRVDPNKLFEILKTD